MTLADRIAFLKSPRSMNSPAWGWQMMNVIDELVGRLQFISSQLDDPDFYDCGFGVTDAKDASDLTKPFPESK